MFTSLTSRNNSTINEEPVDTGRIQIWLRTLAKATMNKVHPSDDQNHHSATLQQSQTTQQHREEQQDTNSISSEDTYIENFWNRSDFYDNSSSFIVPVWLLQQHARQVNPRLRTAGASEVDVGDVLWSSPTGHYKMEVGDNREMPDQRQARDSVYLDNISYYDNMYNFGEDFYSPTAEHYDFQNFTLRHSNNSSGSSSSSYGYPPYHDPIREYFASSNIEPLDKSPTDPYYGQFYDLGGHYGNHFKYLEEADGEKLQSPSRCIEYNVDSPCYDLENCEVTGNDVKVRSRSLSECSYVDRVVLEIVDTERKYVSDLKDIVEGYMSGIVSSNSFIFSEEDFKALFGNIAEIYSFNREFLQTLDSSSGDAVRVARCFTTQRHGFTSYSNYCTNYPRAIEILIRCSKDEEMSKKLLEIQKQLRHSLPLGSYLLKPVQRILRYHLLLQKLLDNHADTQAGHADIEEAVKLMMGVAKNIDMMKSKHESAVRTQEIQSHLVNWRGPNLASLGNLVLEDSFRLCGAKAPRLLFLFTRALIIAKRREDGALLVKSFITCSNIMLNESIPKQALNFQLVPFDSPRIQYTIQARSFEQKKKWCQEIKRLMLDSYNGTIPDKAKELVMRLGNNRDTGDKSRSPRDFLDAARPHPAAPEYLERWRGRRKSAGILQDLKLKTKKETAADLSPHQLSPTPPPRTPRRKSDGGDFRNLVNDLKKKSRSQILTATTSKQSNGQKNRHPDSANTRKENISSPGASSIVLGQPNIYENIVIKNTTTGEIIIKHEFTQRNRSANPCRNSECTNNNNIGHKTDTQQADNKTSSKSNYKKKDRMQRAELSNNGEYEEICPIGNLHEQDFMKNVTRKDSVMIGKTRIGSTSRIDRDSSYVTMIKLDLPDLGSLNGSTSDLSASNTETERTTNSKTNCKTDMESTSNCKQVMLESKQLLSPSCLSPDCNVYDNLLHSHIIPRRRSFDCGSSGRKGQESPSTPVIIISNAENIKSKSAGNSPSVNKNRLRRIEIDVLGKYTETERKISCENVSKCQNYNVIQTPVVDMITLRLLDTETMTETAILDVEKDDVMDKHDKVKLSADILCTVTLGSTIDLTNSIDSTNEEDNSELNDSLDSFKAAVIDSNLFSSEELNDICNKLKYNDNDTDNSAASEYHYPIVIGNTDIATRISYEKAPEEKETKITSKKGPPRSRLRLKIPRKYPVQETRTLSTDRIKSLLKNTFNSVASRFSGNSPNLSHFFNLSAGTETAGANEALKEDPGTDNTDNCLQTLHPARRQVKSQNTAESSKIDQIYNCSTMSLPYDLSPSDDKIEDNPIVRSAPSTLTPGVTSPGNHTSSIMLDSTTPKAPPRKHRLISGNRSGHISPKTAPPESTVATRGLSDAVQNDEVILIKSGKRSKSVDDFRRESLNQQFETSIIPNHDAENHYKNITNCLSYELISDSKHNSSNGVTLPSKVNVRAVSCPFDHKDDVMTVHKTRAQISERMKEIGELLLSFDSSKSHDISNSHSLEDSASQSQCSSVDLSATASTKKFSRSSSPKLTHFLQKEFDACAVFS